MKILLLALAILFSSVSCDSCSPKVERQDDKVHVIVGDTGKPLYWDKSQYPIQLDVDSRFPMDALVVITMAVDAWEEASGRNLFVLTLINDEVAILNPPNGHVTLSYANLTETPNGKHLGETRPFLVRGMKTRIHSMTVEVDTSLVYSSPRLYAVVLHELGHTLLIHHDWDITSIMYKDAISSNFLIHNKHVKHIQDRYGPVLMP